MEKVILSGMHPIGQILNYDYRREHQGNGTEHFHTPIHVLDAPKLDEHDDDVVTYFIDKYVTCSLSDANERTSFHYLVTKLQTHHHTTTCRKKKVLDADLMHLVHHQQERQLHANQVE